MTRRCPWSGNECECVSFPWLENEVIPARCEADLPIEMAGCRKVSGAMKERYRLYLIPCRRCKQRFEKLQPASVCPRCSGVA